MYMYDSNILKVDKAYLQWALNPIKDIAKDT